MFFPHKRDAKGMKANLIRDHKMEFKDKIKLQAMQDDCGRDS